MDARVERIETGNADRNAWVIGDDEEVIVTCDGGDMGLLIGRHGQTIDAVQAIYRKHSSAMSNPYVANILGDYQQRKAAFDSFFEACGDRLAR